MSGEMSMAETMVMVVSETRPAAAMMEARTVDVMKLNVR
jgi:hypothetical protein